jgi:hypothetical protein
MISSLARARILGALLALTTFALGVGAGVWYRGRVRPGITITVTATDHLPAELERLGLTEAERGPVHAALQRGRDRVLRARDQLDILMHSAVDSTDQEIRAVLTDAQRASFDSARRVNGPPLRRKETFIHR